MRCLAVWTMSEVGSCDGPCQYFHMMLTSSVARANPPQFLRWCRVCKLHGEKEYVVSLRMDVDMSGIWTVKAARKVSSTHSIRTPGVTQG